MLSLTFAVFLECVDSVATPEFFCRGHRRGKMWFWGGKNSKFCRKWLIWAIFSSDGGGGKWGTEPPTGGGGMPHAPPPWCRHCVDSESFNVSLAWFTSVNFVVLWWVQWHNRRGGQGAECPPETSDREFLLTYRERKKEKGWNLRRKEGIL